MSPHREIRSGYDQRKPDDDRRKQYTLACWCWRRDCASRRYSWGDVNGCSSLRGDYHRDGYPGPGVCSKGRTQPGIGYDPTIPWPEYLLHLANELYTSAAEQETLDLAGLQRQVYQPLHRSTARPGGLHRRDATFPEGEDWVGVQQRPDHFTRPSNATSSSQVLQGLNHEVEP